MNAHKYRNLLGFSALALNAFTPFSPAIAQPDQSSGQAALSDVPYFHTDKTQACQIGTAGWSWPLTYEGKTVLIVANAGEEKGNTILFEYPIPKTDGVTGRFAGIMWDVSSVNRPQVFLGDFDGTKKPNFALLKGGSNNFRVYGDLLVSAQEIGIFRDFQQVNLLGAWEYAWTDDFDGDGVVDFASANGSKVSVSISESDQGSNEIGWRTAEWSVTPNWGQAGYTFTGDFDGNGKADIASALGTNVFMKLSSGADFTSETWPASMTWGGAEYTWAGDFNGDNRDDILSVTAGTASVAFSTGSGFHVRFGKVSNNWGAGAYTWAHDFNNDGKTDIATANGCDVTVKLSDGEGNFTDQPSFRLDLPAGKPKCRWLIFPEFVSDADWAEALTIMTDRGTNLSNSVALSAARETGMCS